MLGVSINKAMDGGVTPLNVTAQNAREAVVRALIDAGADVNIAVDGLTPLSVSMAPISNVLQGRHAADFQMLRSADFA